MYEDTQTVGKQSLFDLGCTIEFAALSQTQKSISPNQIPSVNLYFRKNALMKNSKS